jgi:hypothetical protein
MCMCAFGRKEEGGRDGGCEKKRKPGAENGRAACILCCSLVHVCTCMRMYFIEKVVFEYSAKL